MAWWRVSNVPTAWPATEGQAPTAAPAPVLQVEQQGGYVGVPEQAPPAPPNHAIPHAAALKNARLALARLTESIQSIAHPSAQDAPLVPPKSYSSEQKPLVLSVESEARLLHYLLHAAIQDGRALGITPALALLPSQQQQQDRGTCSPTASSSTSSSSNSSSPERPLTNGSLIPCLLPMAEALTAAYPSITQDMPALGPSFTPGSAPWPCVLLVIRNPETALQAVAKARAAMLGVVLVRTALQALNDITEGLSSITGYQAVVTESHFPYMGGLELVTRLRRDGGPEWRTKPVILVRGHDHPTDHTLMPEAARRVGASEFVESFEAMNFEALRATILRQSGSPPVPLLPIGASSGPQPLLDIGGHVQVAPLPLPPSLRRCNSSSQSASSMGSVGHRLVDETATQMVTLEEEGEDMAYDSGSDNGKGMANNKRIKRACSYCHTKKVLCSGERPCTRCTSLHIQCTEYKPKPRLGKRQTSGSNTARPPSVALSAPHSSSVPPQAVASGPFQPSAAAATGAPLPPPWAVLDASTSTSNTSTSSNKAPPPSMHRSHPAHLPGAPAPLPAPHHPIIKPPHGSSDAEQPPAPPPPPQALRILLPPSGPATPSPGHSPAVMDTSRRQHAHPAERGAPAPPPPRPHACLRAVPSMSEMEQGLDRLGLTPSSDDPSVTYLRNFLLSNPDLYTAYVTAHNTGAPPPQMMMMGAPPPFLVPGHALPPGPPVPLLPPQPSMAMAPSYDHMGRPPPPTDRHPLWPPQQAPPLLNGACDPHQPRGAAPCWRPQLMVRSARPFVNGPGGEGGGGDLTRVQTCAAPPPSSMAPGGGGGGGGPGSA